MLRYDRCHLDMVKLKEDAWFSNQKEKKKKRDDAMPSFEPEIPAIKSKTRAFLKKKLKKLKLKYKT